MYFAVGVPLELQSNGTNVFYYRYLINMFKWSEVNRSGWLCNRIVTMMSQFEKQAAKTSHSGGADNDCTHIHCAFACILDVNLAMVVTNS